MAFFVMGACLAQEVESEGDYRAAGQRPAEFLTLKWSDRIAQGFSPGLPGYNEVP
jgi:hypothetical protein